MFCIFAMLHVWGELKSLGNAYVSQDVSTFSFMHLGFHVSPLWGFMFFLFIPLRPFCVCTYMHTSAWVSRRLPLSRHGWITYACFLARQRRDDPEGRPSSCPKKRRCCGATNQKADAAESPSPFHYVPWCCTSYVLWCFMSTMCIH